MEHVSPDVGSVNTDVCIIGAGPAGITLAMELSRHGIHSVLLDSGDQQRDRRADDLNDGDSVGECYFPLDECRVRAFGGTSRHWHLNGWFRARPLDELDFEERPGIAHSGWPIKRAELDGAYERASALCAVGPHDYDIAGHPAAATGGLPTDPAVVRSVLFRLTKRDWGVWYAKVAADPRITQLLGATATRILLDEDGRAVGAVEVANGDGTRLLIHPRRLVLAGGGIENARLLLVSTDRHPAGIGNVHDVVGRYFHEHLSNRSGHIVLAHPERIRGLDLYRSLPTAQPGAAVAGKLSLAEDVVRQQGLLNATFFLERRTASRAHPAVTSLATLRRAVTWRPLPDHLMGHAQQAGRGAGALLRSAVEQVRGVQESHATVLQLRSMAEQAPNPDSRITLSHRRDRNGVPLPRVAWRLTELDRRSLAITYRLVDAELRRAGIGHIEQRFGDEDVPSQVWGNWHHMGTTRMHEDPRVGVVDRDCRVHGIANLFVAGSSVFPTGGYANPTLTIVALAVRLADHLAVGT